MKETKDAQNVVREPLPRGIQLGVRNGWRHGIVFLSSEALKCGARKSVKKDSFCADFRNFTQIRPLKDILGLWRIAIPFAWIPYSHKVRADSPVSEKLFTRFLPRTVVLTGPECAPSTQPLRHRLGKEGG